MLVAGKGLDEEVTPPLAQSSPLGKEEPREDRVRENGKF
jgi:hypothetical protein